MKKPRYPPEMREQVSSQGIRVTRAAQIAEGKHRIDCMEDCLLCTNAAQLD
jgi:hypothetical protein